MRHPIDFLRSRKQEYMALVRWMMVQSGAMDFTPGRMRAMADLAKFCRWGQTCFDPDPRIHAVLEGRREAFQRIVDHLQLNPIQLAALYGARFTEDRE
jgi:hypothetical protein